MSHISMKKLKGHEITHFKRVNCTVCKFYSNKAIFTQERQEQNGKFLSRKPLPFQKMHFLLYNGWGDNGNEITLTYLSLFLDFDVLLTFWEPQVSSLLLFI